ncbi:MULTISPECIES: flagellar biosynthesis anti-sigma factor FlgM [Enterobacterales]|uniref:flagellar biosynthesis anti-sigma factor FlgM n=1 Tax=Enterobacterales TaxID=91347 RepID=UPI0008480D09|nr:MULTISPECIES: flagellar biosynthesis anti-sigma factor FlgM [Enterobacterales]WOO48451.1 flagellar biosynthesis anti-sigma factor FlgM [Hafnia alvei]MCK9781690.1 anti-sigma-28 factor FlgM [Proteus columbae]MCT6519250.1 flagellar biosynthesis anti-sigma factor FlgM [Proteus vulgaris]ODQ07588.1 flagellar biosynthesis anti-sigma factor FlgM [Shigella sp. FC130]OEI95131.1 anti-sigma-28 factor FlgM [Shigella sp. FC1655]
MSIERANPLLPITAITQRNPSEITQGSRKSGTTEQKTATGDTSVKLSEAQKKLVQPGNKDINVEKVARLKEAIANGTLTMDSGKIADALFREAAESITQ